MDYELAKRLKEAGFPQKEQLIEYELAKEPLTGVGYHITAEDDQVDDNGKLLNKARRTSIFLKEWINSKDGRDATVYLPTLEELISACGDFIAIWQYPEGWVAGQRDNLIGMEKNYIDNDPPYHLGHGKTPSEAVANLWISLNKK